MRLKKPTMCTKVIERGGRHGREPSRPFTGFPTECGYNQGGSRRNPGAPATGVFLCLEFDPLAGLHVVDDHAEADGLTAGLGAVEGVGRIAHVSALDKEP